MRREWQMSKKSKNRYISHNDLDRADKPNQDGSVASAESVNSAGQVGSEGSGGAAGSVSSALEASQAFIETAEVLNKGEAATLEDALAQNQAAEAAAAAAAASAVSAATEAAASDQEAELAASLAAAEPNAQGMPEPISQEMPEVSAQGMPEAGVQAEAGEQGVGAAASEAEPAILHSSRALEDDPAVKAAQVLARDNAEELALREAEDAEQVRLTAKENVAIPPLKPVDNIENLKTAGQVLRYHRQRMGMSIKEVADALKARPTTIANIESDLLNTPNVQNMVGRQVILYADLLGLNPKEVHDLYLQGIKEDVVIEHVTVPRPRTDRRMNRTWLVVVLMIVVATAGFFVFGGKEDAPSSAQGSLNEAALDASHDTSAALVTSDAKLTVGNNAPVVIEEEPAADAPQVMVVDENTAKATEQQYNLKQMEAAAAAAAKDLAPQPEALLLPEGVAHEPETQVETNVPEVDSKLVASEPEVSAPERPSNAVKSEPVATPAPVATEAAAAEASAPQEPAVTKEEAAQEAAPKPAAKPELAASLKNISSSVKVVGRDGLASLNRAEIAVTAPVALEVIDGSGKRVRSGVFDAGDVVKITAIPPIVVKLSDTSAVKISYMGGTIALPAGKQVRFELPQR